MSTRPSFTLGIEGEYQTIDPVTRDLRSHIQAQIIARGRMRLQERVKPEMHGSVVEVGTGICRTIAEARGEVFELRRHMVKLAQDNNLRLAAAGRIRATTPLGTDITAELSPSLRWLKTSGIISPDKWGNLPGGEVFTSPALCNGTFVVDGAVGDYLCAKHGDLGATPLTIEITDSRIRSVRCVNRELEREFLEYCRTDSNSDRVGELAIGTNIALTHVIGHILQDEKIPGVHIAFGHPYAEHTGADWISSTHIDVVGTKFDIWIDDTKIMAGGRFILQGDS